MSYLALYRRYRPQSFRELVGQKPITITLQNQVRSGQIAHAYLFCGTRGTGKTSTAHIFARAINCLSPQDAEACGHCEACLSAKTQSPDILEIDAASNNGVEEIRDLREKVRFAPLESRYKVYIIDEVHMLSGAAFNALLKTLEEPPSHAVFILATTESQKLPATVLSRCQRFDFRRISLDDIIERLKDVLADVGASFEPEALRSIAISAQGALRDALSLADQCISFCGNEVSNEQVLSILGSMDQTFLFEIVDALLINDSARALLLLEKVIQNGRDLGVFCRDLGAHFRALMLMKASDKKAQEILHCTDDQAQRYAEQSDRSSLEKILRSVSLIIEAESNMRHLDSPRIILELLLIRICRPEDENGLIGDGKNSRYIELLAERIGVLEERINSGTLSISAPNETNTTENCSNKNSSAKIQKKNCVEENDSELLTIENDKAAILAESVQNNAEESIKEAPTEVKVKPQADQTAQETVFNNPNDFANEIFASVQSAQVESIRQIFRLYKWNCQMNGNILEIQAPPACLPALLKTLRSKEQDMAESVISKYPGLEIRFVNKLTVGELPSPDFISQVEVKQSSDNKNSSDLGERAKELFGEKNIIFE